ncbi:MAG: hypothetical protein IT372_15650 [Polyangiaceae bacterium]|nr:hypothetical protein [Polyangiaceae bacterium]
MIRRASALLLIASTGLLLTGACKKDEDPQSIPVPSAAPSAAPVAADQVDSSAPAASAAPVAPVAPAATGATQPAAPTKVATESIDACCAALNTMSVFSGKSAEAKSKAGAGAKICNGISKLVKEGKTSKAAAMAQIKAAISGITPPPECN